jgi:two-component system, LytTR family, sensor kinase
MQKAWTPPVRWILLVAAILSLFSTAQAYRLTTLNLKVPSDIEVGSLLVLNTAYWFVPAAFTIPIFYLARRYRLDARRWAGPLAIHIGAAVLFSVVHLGCMVLVRMALWPSAGKPPSISWTLFAQRQYLMQLDWLLMTYSAIIGLSYALDYRRESQARAIKAATLETRLVEAHLKTLQAEMHPHFLFNTLHAISTLVHTNPESADRMISRLSDLLRLTFDRTGASAVSLQEELEFLQKYLEIEQIRFQDRLSVDYDIDAETLDAEVPRLILQPLVENAIKHGVSPRSGRGLIQISSRIRDGALWIEIRDNGVGLSGQALSRLNAGVGLSNTRARLECLYGTAHRLEFSEGSEGVAVQMQIPLTRVPPGAGGAAMRVA